jgi:hypothetical protein
VRDGHTHAHGRYEHRRHERLTGCTCDSAKAAHELLRQAENEFNFNIFELDRGA